MDPNASERIRTPPKTQKNFQKLAKNRSNVEIFHNLARSAVTKATLPGGPGCIKVPRAASSGLVGIKVAWAASILIIAVRSTFLRKYFPKSSVPHIFGRHFLAVDFWLRWFLLIFACRGGPGSAARCGGGPRGTQKLIRFFFFCSPEPFTKIFWKRKPRENLAKT